MPRAQIRVDNLLVVANLVGCALRDDAAVVHDDHAVAGAHDEVEVVLDDEQRDAVAPPQVEDVLEQLDPERRADARHRLVEQQDARLRHQRADEVEARYNICPGAPDWVIRQSYRTRAFRFEAFHWGLLPAWTKDPKSARRPINARAESVAERPMFRDLLRQRRCVVPVDGYYEWRTTSSGKVLFAHAPGDDRNRLLARRLESFTERTVTSVRDLRKDFELIVRDGYATSYEEFELGLNAAAVAVHDHDGVVIAALSASGPSYRFSRKRMREVVGKMSEAAQDLSAQLGYLD